MQIKITIGSRGSNLALWQANYVKDKLSSLGIESNIKIIKTKGDKIQNLSFDKAAKQWLVRSQTIDFGYSLFGFKGNGSFVANYTNYDLNPKLSTDQNKNEILVFEKNANKSHFCHLKNPI